MIMDAPIDYSMAKNKNTLSPTVRRRSTIAVKSVDSAHCSNVIEQQHSPMIEARSTKKRKTNHTEPFFDPDSTISSNEPTLYVCRLCDQMFDSLDGRKVHEWNAHLLIIKGEGSRHANGLRIHQYSEPMEANRGHMTSHNDLHVRDKIHQIRVALNAQPKVVLHPMELKQPSRRADREESSAEQSGSSSPVKKNVTMKRKQLTCESCPEIFTTTKALNCHSRKHHRCSSDGAETTVPLKTKPVCETRSSSEVEGTNTSDEVLKNTVGVLITPYFAPNKDGHEYKCVVCTEVFDSFEAVQSHYQTHHSSKDFSKFVPFQCSVCHAVFRNYSGIKGHISVHSPKCFNCPHCDQSFTNKVKFSRHVKFHQRAFLTCEKCSRTFRTSLGRVNHKCRGRSGRSAKNDRTRVDTAANEGAAINRSSEVFRCKYCPREFSTSNGCNGHISKMHSRYRLFSENEQSGTKGPALCKLCGLGLEPDQMASHMRGHTFDVRRLAKTGEVNAEPKELDQFGCDTCDKVFICRKDLSEHVRVHAEDQMLVEDSSSNSKSAAAPIAAALTPLKISVPLTRLPALSARAHTHPSTSSVNLENVISKQLSTNVAQSRPKMDQCSPLELLNHIEEKRRTENKRYTFEPCGTTGRFRCSECDETFSDKLQMLIHMSYHLNGEQQPNEPDSSLMIKVESSLLAPHACKFCDQRFISAGHLNLHVGKHHRSELLECEICEELCMGKKELEQHHEREHTHRCVYCGLRCLSDSILVHHMEMKCKMRRAKETNRVCIPEDFKMEVKSEIKLEITSSEETFFGREDYNDDGTADSSMAEMKVKMENIADSELFHCNCCNRNFASEFDMYAHENQPQNLLFCCGLCNLYFFDASLAEVHSKMHILS